MPRGRTTTGADRGTKGGAGTRCGVGTRDAPTPDDDRRGRAEGRPPRTRRPGVALAAAAFFCLTAATCGDVTEPSEGQRGILRVEPADPAAATDAGAASAAAPGPGDVTEGSIEAPEQVRVGETFTATVTTVGLDGCWEALGETLSVQGLAAEIVPFDTDGGGEDVACTQALVFLEHRVDLSFDEPGEAVVRVEGRRVVGLAGGESEPLALETSVTVVP